MIHYDLPISQVSSCLKKSRFLLLLFKLFFCLYLISKQVDGFILVSTFVQKVLCEGKLSSVRTRIDLVFLIPKLTLNPSSLVTVSKWLPKLSHVLWYLSRVEILDPVPAYAIPAPVPSKHTGHSVLLLIILFCYCWDDNQLRIHYIFERYLNKHDFLLPNHYICSCSLKKFKTEVCIATCLFCPKDRVLKKFSPADLKYSNSNI